ncbi:MAG: AAA family ATPase [Gaiellaceae bacterium]
MSRACAACGAEHESGARFCSTCGASLWRVCPACGAEDHAAAAFCSTCGFALVEGARRAGAIVEGTDERRVVTVLFADLAGSTALGERLDPEDVREVQGELYSLVNDVVDRFGGITEKFVGDAVLAVFGAPQSHEDDPERAVRAALAIAEAFEPFARRVRELHAAEVGLRIGVNTGEVVAGREASARGELMVSGDAVNVAARLQQLARPGTVLAGVRTRQATRRTIAYRQVEALTAKGKTGPLEAWEAIGVTAPLGTRRSGFGAPLIGRDDELALLRLAAARVRRERTPQLFTVYGHAGVGKSRLVEEFVTDLEHAQILVGSCVPYGDGITYLPLIDVASALAGILDDDSHDVAIAKLRAAVEQAVAPEHVSQVLGGVAWTIGLSLPDSASGLAGGGDVRRTLHQAWAHYLAALGRANLVVLLIEDIHWASEPLLDLVDHVFGALEDCAALIVCLARPELVSARPSWGAGRVNTSSVMLTPLGKRESEALLQALLGAETVPERVARSILDPADGNPFFVEEMLSMLVEQGALEQRDEVWMATDRLDLKGVPDSIHGIIAARIDLLNAPEREALRRCSVMGRIFWPSAVEVDDGVIAGLTSRALVSEQVSSSFSGRREFSFKHALTHEVAYQTLPRAERRALHRRVADWIREAVPDRQAETTELVAYHYDQALQYGEADDDLRQRAFAALLAAGDAVSRRGAYASAARLLDRALDLAPTEDDHARALLLAARVDVHNGNYPGAVDRLDEVIAAAAQAENAALRADALGWKARATWLRGDWRDALQSAQEATVALEGQADSPELARALARLSQIEMLRGLPSAESTASRAIEVARRTGEATAEANARTNLFTAQSAAGVVPETAEMQAVVELALESGAPDEAARAVVNFLWTAALMGPPEAAEEIVNDALGRLGPGLASENYARYLALSLAVLVFVPTGRWAEADAVAATKEPVGVATNRLVWLWLTCGLAFRRGDLELTDRYLPELRDDALASEEPQRIVPMACVAMPRALLAGDLGSLQTIAETVLGLPWQAVMHGPSTTSISRSLAAAGETDLLRRLTLRLGELEATADIAVASVTARGLCARLESRPGEAARLLAQAEQEVWRLGRRYEAACLALELSHALEAAGDRVEAADALVRANEVLVPLGCVNPY